MSISIQSVVQLAYQQVGMTMSNEQVNGDDGAMAISLLNNLLHQWNVDAFLPWTREVVTAKPSAQQITYTIGIQEIGFPAPDISAIRPDFINRLLYYPSVNTRPMNVQQQDLSDLLYRQTVVTAIGTPLFFALDGNYPYQTLYFDIKPQAGSQWIMIYNAPIQDVSISTKLSAPMEYMELFITGLARKLCAYFQLPSDTCANAKVLWEEAFNRIRRANSRSKIPTLDDLTGSNSMRVNNILTGNASR